VLYDKVNKVLVTQWMDSKVVSCTSTLTVSGLVDMKRRSRSTIWNLQVERSLKSYQEGMDGVDRGDQYRDQGVGFASLRCWMSCSLIHSLPGTWLRKQTTVESML